MLLYCFLFQAISYADSDGYKYNKKEKKKLEVEISKRWDSFVSDTKTTNNHEKIKKIKEKELAWFNYYKKENPSLVIYTKLNISMYEYRSLLQMIPDDKKECGLKKAEIDLFEGRGEGNYGEKLSHIYDIWQRICL